MRHAPPLCFLVLSAFFSLFAHEREFALHVLKAQTSEGEVAACRWRGAKNDGPVFGFHLDAGHVFDDEILAHCTQSTEVRTVKEVSFPVVTVTCGEVRMTISGIDLGE